MKWLHIVSFQVYVLNTMFPFLFRLTVVCFVKLERGKSWISIIFHLHLFEHTIFLYYEKIKFQLIIIMNTRC